VFDLEMKAYLKTGGLAGFTPKFPWYEELHFKLLGLVHALSMFHIDIVMTWIFIAGPGEKIWIRSRGRNGQDDMTDAHDFDAHDFDNWDPDRASVDTHDCEITALPAGGGTL
jgi:hypothetical protein